MLGSVSPPGWRLVRGLVSAVLLVVAVTAFADPGMGAIARRQAPDRLISG